MSRTICIELDDDGTVSVGEEPPEAEVPEQSGAAPAEGAEAAPTGTAAAGGEEEAEKAYMKPAKNIDDALRQAKALLEQPQTTDGSQSPFEQGFAQAQGAPDMGGTAGGLGA